MASVKLMFKLELGLVNMLLFVLLSLTHLVPNDAFSFPRQHNDNQALPSSVEASAQIHILDPTPGCYGILWEGRRLGQTTVFRSQFLSRKQLWALRPDIFNHSNIILAHLAKPPVLCVQG